MVKRRVGYCWILPRENTIVIHIGEIGVGQKVFFGFGGFLIVVAKTTFDCILVFNRIVSLS